MCPPGLVRVYDGSGSALVTATVPVMTYMVQNAIPYFTGLPEDVVTNTFHFDWGSPTPPVETDLGVLVSSVAAFYENVFADPGTLWCAPWMRPALNRVRIYDLDMPTPRPPIFDEVVPLTLEMAPANNIAPESAIVLSYHGAIVSGVNAARRRGRVYIGGLGSGIDTGSASAFPKINASAINQCINAAQELVAAEAVTNFTWVVYSRVSQSSTPIVGGWVDNAIDTQRRRGNASTGRSTWAPLP